jgi:SHAQKYF class myb-like DNA-binding protein
MANGVMKNITYSLKVMFYPNNLGLRLYGKNWKLIEKIVTTRSGAQIRSHAQKYFNKLDRHR